MTNDGSGVAVHQINVGRACIEVARWAGAITLAGGPFLQSGSVTYYGEATKFVSHFITFLRGD